MKTVTTKKYPSDCTSSSWPSEELLRQPVAERRLAPVQLGIAAVQQALEVVLVRVQLRLHELDEVLVHHRVTGHGAQGRFAKEHAPDLAGPAPLTRRR
ncbi:MAG: hypothetical protein H6726_20275 [Sandaracinaceae bacterium]|nr:hypothetical protein [Sandaracinaceae bacterium]